jgi:hypothetical protein
MFFVSERSKFEQVITILIIKVKIANIRLKASESLNYISLFNG